MASRMPETYVVRMEWDSVEGHEQGFSQELRLGEFFSAVKPFFDDIEEMRHYRSLLTTLEQTHDVPTRRRAGQR